MNIPKSRKVYKWGLEYFYKMPKSSLGMVPPNSLNKMPKSMPLIMVGTATLAGHSFENPTFLAFCSLIRQFFNLSWHFTWVIPEEKTKHLQNHYLSIKQTNKLIKLRERTYRIGQRNRHEPCNKHQYHHTVSRLDNPNNPLRNTSRIWFPML